MVAPVKRPRPQVTYGVTRRFNIGERAWFATVNLADDATLLEVFLKGASDPVAQEQQEFLGKMISPLLRNYVPTERIIKALKGIKSEPTYNGGELMESVPDALAKILKHQHDEGNATLLDKLSINPPPQTEMDIPTLAPTMVARPRVLPSKTFTFKIGHTQHRLIATLYEGRPFEIWAALHE
jgi:hypothetical protein